MVIVRVYMKLKERQNHGTTNKWFVARMLVRTEVIYIVRESYFVFRQILFIRVTIIP